MIITQAPLRMSFVGGGSDIPAYYEKYGGAVLSASIDKYVFVTINRKFDDGIRVSYSKTENVESVAEVKHEIVRACMNFTGVTSGIEITSIADIPSRGTGLGSSSSFTVALLQGLYAYKGTYIDKETLARESCHVEIDICRSPIGLQDQYASAYGGMNYIEFCKNGAVKINPIICKKDTIKSIEKNLLLLYTGKTRSASALLKKQTERTNEDVRVQTTLQKMVGVAKSMKEDLQLNKTDSFGEMLHENWLLKRSLMDGISDPEIDGWYEIGRKAGAIGGKILGAGAGGFLLLYAPFKCHSAIKQALPDLRPVPVAFENDGCKVIFYK